MQLNLPYNNTFVSIECLWFGNQTTVESSEINSIELFLQLWEIVDLNVLTRSRWWDFWVIMQQYTIVGLVCNDSSSQLKEWIPLLFWISPSSFVQFHLPYDVTLQASQKNKDKKIERKKGFIPNFCDPLHEFSLPFSYVHY